MSDRIEDLHDIINQHHYRHRDESNASIVYTFWGFVCALLLLKTLHRPAAWLIQRRLRSTPQYCPKASTTWHFLRSAIACVEAFWIISLPRVPATFSIPTVSFGRLFSIVAYSMALAALIVSVDAPRFSSHFIDDVAFRSGWITVTQIPLVYLLSAKQGPLNLFAGISYERVKWIHRWIGYSLFVSAFAHMAIMMRSISVSEVFSSSERGMAVVRYGIGTFSVLTWIALTSPLPIRKRSYGLFYTNHLISTVVFLWFVFQHVPKAARFPVYLAIGVISFDKVCAVGTFLRWNIMMAPNAKRARRPRRSSKRKLRLGSGHSVKMVTSTAARMGTLNHGSPAGNDTEPTTVIRICNVQFGWRPGQHIRLYVPALGRYEMHPFTPANCDNTAHLSDLRKRDAIEERSLLSSDPASQANEMVLMIRSHKGFTRRLGQYYSEWLSLPCPNSSEPSSSLTAYLNGPYGNPPSWEQYEKLILVATSTGVSFILSILDYLGQRWFEGEDIQTQDIRFVWVVRHLEPGLEATVTDFLSRHTAILREAGVEISVEFHITCPQSDDMESDYDPFAHFRRRQTRFFHGKPPLRIINPDDIIRGHFHDDESDTESVSSLPRSSITSDDSSTLIDENDRPSISDLDVYIPAEQRSWWSRVSSIRNFFRRKAPTRPQCNCQAIQYQRKKLNVRKSGDFFVRHFGSRPDISRIIISSTPRTEDRNAMVAVCANQAISRDVTQTVAKIKLDYALQKRRGSVNVFTEGFG